MLLVSATVGPYKSIEKAEKVPRLKRASRSS